MQEKTEGTIKNGQSRETGNIRYTRHMTKTNKTKQKTQATIQKTNKNNINMTRALLQTTGSNIVFMRKS